MNFKEEGQALTEALRALFRSLYPGKCFRIEVHTSLLSPDDISAHITREPDQDKNWEDGSISTAGKWESGK